MLLKNVQVELKVLKVSQGPKAPKELQVVKALKEKLELLDESFEDEKETNDFLEPTQNP